MPVNLLIKVDDKPSRRTAQPRFAPARTSEGNRCQMNASTGAVEHLLSQRTDELVLSDSEPRTVAVILACSQASRMPFAAGGLYRLKTNNLGARVRSRPGLALRPDPVA